MMLGSVSLEVCNLMALACTPEASKGSPSSSDNFCFMENLRREPHFQTQVHVVQTCPKRLSNKELFDTWLRWHLSSFSCGFGKLACPRISMTTGSQQHDIAIIDGSRVAE